MNVVLEGALPHTNYTRVFRSGWYFINILRVHISYESAFVLLPKPKRKSYAKHFRTKIAQKNVDEIDT